MTTDTTFRCPACGEPLEARKSVDPRARYNHDEAAALLRFGATVTEVAALYGVTSQAISYLRKQRGIASNRTSTARLGGAMSEVETTEQPAPQPQPEPLPGQTELEPDQTDDDDQAE